MLINQGFYALKPSDTPTPIIWAFRGEFKFLSNFTECNVTLPAENSLPALEFETTENAYVAWKTLDLKARKHIQTLSPGDAKDFSHSEGFLLRPDYSDEGRLAIMENLTEQKYSLRNPLLREKLLNTKNATLIEGNTWNDTFFGFSLPDGTGKNHLGRIIMRTRAAITS